MSDAPSTSTPHDPPEPDATVTRSVVLTAPAEAVSDALEDPELLSVWIGPWEIDPSTGDTTAMTDDLSRYIATRPAIQSPPTSANRRSRRDGRCWPDRRHGGSVASSWPPLGGASLTCTNPHARWNPAAVRPTVEVR